MLHLAENLKSLRKGKDLTQEDVAEMLGVSAQSVSKWERGDTFPDITLLPTLANLYKVSVDALIGMDRINDTQGRAAVFIAGHEHLRGGDIDAAVEVYSSALKTFPNDESLMSELALALALYGDPMKLKQAVSLCERVLSGNPSEKVRHTTRAALCFILFKLGEKDKAVAAAQNLPHIRESRETILAQLEEAPTADVIDAYLKFVALGDNDEQDVIEISFGLNIASVWTEYDPVAKIEKLRREVGAQHTREGLHRLPKIRVRDKCELSPNQVRVRYYANYLLDKEFSVHSDAADEILAVLQKIAK